MEGGPLHSSEETNIAGYDTGMDSHPSMGSDLPVTSSVARAQAHLLLRAFAKALPGEGKAGTDSGDGGAHVNSGAADDWSRGEDLPFHHRAHGGRRTYAEEKAERERRKRDRQSDVFEGIKTYQKGRRSYSNFSEGNGFAALTGAAPAGGGVDVLALRWPLEKGVAQDWQNHLRAGLTLLPPEHAPLPLFMDGGMPSEHRTLEGGDSSTFFPASLGKGGEAGISDQPFFSPPFASVGAGADSRDDLPLFWEDDTHMMEEEDEALCREAAGGPLPPSPLRSVLPSPLTLVVPSMNPQGEREGSGSRLGISGKLHDGAMGLDGHPAGSFGGIASTFFPTQPHREFSSLGCPQLIGSPEDDILPPPPGGIFTFPDHSVCGEGSFPAIAPEPRLKSSMAAPFIYPACVSTDWGLRPVKEDKLFYDDRMHAPLSGQRFPGELISLFSDPSIVQIPPKLAPPDDFLEAPSLSWHCSLHSNPHFSLFNPASPPAGRYKGEVGAKLVQEPTANLLRSWRPPVEASPREVLRPSRARLSSSSSSAYGPGRGGDPRAFTASFERSAPPIIHSIPGVVRTAWGGRNETNTVPSGFRPSGKHPASRRQQFLDRCQRPG
ncbi:unnamed protein product [Phytomonas sp. Hart1]|nr:unnamed protein product [Phytomonas sp. Hart1]|eukprot:CCW70707.1 unnamed protein product [Phytomonas sp. isolate Hart1]